MSCTSYMKYIHTNIHTYTLTHAHTSIAQEETYKDYSHAFTFTNTHEYTVTLWTQ